MANRKSDYVEDDHMYRRILVALDGGAAAEASLEQAILIAQASDAEVEVIFVLDISAPFLDIAGADPVRMAENLTTAAEGVLAAAATKLDRARVRFTTCLSGRSGIQQGIAETIAAEADAWSADLIAMGNNGNHGPSGPRMGEIVRKVMARTRQPLLLARAQLDRNHAPSEVHRRAG
ncbi:universal stress protein [Cupriavidus necator]|nr:universal stress protein [Cupriavidus necator]